MSMRRKLTVAVPIYNEESVLPEFYRRTAMVLEDVKDWNFELLFVDDCGAGLRDW